MRLVDRKNIVVYTDDVLGATGQWRNATLLLNPASFGMAVNTMYRVFVAYRVYNFNVRPPRLPEFQSTTWDIIGNLENTEGATAPLTPDEQYVAAHIQYGISYEEFARFNAHPEGFTNPNNLQRFSYMLPLFELPRWYLVHPRKHRTITEQEFEALADDSKIIAWLNEQVALFELNFWAMDDYASKFNSRTNQWEGENTFNEKNKTFDLVQYVPPLKPANMMPNGLCLPEFQDYRGRKNRGNR